MVILITWAFENMIQTEIYFTLYKIVFSLLLRVEEQIIIFVMLEITMQLSLPVILYFSCIIPDIILLKSSFFQVRKANFHYGQYINFIAQT